MQSSLGMFADRIAWTKVLLDRLNLPGNVLREGLQSMREVVANEIRGEIQSSAMRNYPNLQ